MHRLKMITRFVLLHFLLAFSFVKANAQTIYVSPTGSDSSDGRSARTALRTLQKAADAVKPGDVVLISDGTYTNNDTADGGAVLSIRKSGTANAWITWKAAPGAKPVINPKGWAGIQISGSYHVIEGLSILGNNDAIVLLKAQEDAKNKKPNPYFNTNGIAIDGRKNKPAEKPHHIIIRRCTVGKCAGGGIAGLETDYLTVEDCAVFNNAWFMRYGGSGITTLNNWAFDDAPGYHIIIQRNKVWNNKTLVPWESIGKLSDGNGILLDVTDLSSGASNPNADAVVQEATPSKPKDAVAKRPEWKGRALIANNISAFNGGSGIHVFRTKHVDIINNTTYWNGSVVGYQELFPNRSEDVVILNNVIVPRPGGQVTSNNRNVNIRWDYNLYPIAQTFFKGEHDIVGEPFFLDVECDVAKSNFGLKPQSKAVDSGTSELQGTKDVAGRPRVKGKRIDRGAVEQ
jgi:hypothetical protein